MANNKIELKFDFDSKDVEIVSDKVLTLREQVRLLQKELLKTDEGSAQFEILKNKLNDTKDNMERVNAKSRELFGTLQLIPGPIGEIASKIDGTISLFKTFSGFTFKDVKSSISALVKDFGEIANNIGKATGITKIYTVVNQALSKAFVAVGVGEAAAATGARAFAAALTATGIGALVVGLGLAVNALMDFFDSEKAAKEATDEFNKSLETQNLLLDLDTKDMKRRQEKNIASLKANGATEKEIREQGLKDAKEAYDLAYAARLEAAKTHDAGLGKVDAEGLKALQKNLLEKEQAEKDALNAVYVVKYNNKTAENKEQEAAAQKAAQLSKQERDKRKNEAKQAENDIKQFVQAGIEARGKTQKDELDASKAKYDELIAKAKKYGLDQSAITTAYNEQVAAINKTYAEKEQKKKAEDLDAKIQLEVDKANTDKATLETLLNERMAIELANVELTESEKQVIRDKYKKQLDDAIKTDADKAKKDRLDKLFGELEGAKGNADEQLKIYEQLQKELTNKTDYSEKERLELRKQYQDAILQSIDTAYQNQSAALDLNYDDTKRKDSEYYDSARTALDEYQAKLKAANDAGSIDDAEFTKRKNANLKARKELDKAEGQSKIETTAAIGNALGQLSQLVGQDTVAGKAFAIAKATIDTYQSAVAAYKSLAGIPVIGPALGAIAAASAVATGIATVKKIVAVQVPNAPGGSAGGQLQSTPGDTGVRPTINATATPVNKASGGIVRGPGGETSDSIPAYLSDGEFVVNARSTRMFQPLLNSINTASSMPGFASGGLATKTVKRDDSGTERLAQVISDTFNNQPIRTYVTATDISNQQQFDRVAKTRSLI